MLILLGFIDGGASQRINATVQSCYSTQPTARKTRVLPDAVEHAGFAQAQGFSCLGTWRKDECLELCEQLRGRDLSVRALPGVRGRQAWQGEPANTSPDALPSAP